MLHCHVIDDDDDDYLVFLIGNDAHVSSEGLLTLCSLPGSFVGDEYHWSTDGGYTTCCQTPTGQSSRPTLPDREP